MGFDKWRSAREEMEVDLIPVMNLFVVLIPFLLLAAAFYHVGVIPTSLPSQTDGTSDIAADTRSVTVNLQIEDGRIALSASNAALDEETLAQLSMEIADGELDLLRTALYQIKTLYPDSDTVVVLPAAGVSYQEVVAVLDAAREITLDAGTPEERKLPLFPVVVLSRKV